EMDAQVKEGKLYVWQQQSFGKKGRWRNTWAVLYAPSPTGVARLELREGRRAEGARPRRSDRKVLRLSECVSVQEAPDEPGPEEDTAVFRVATAERALAFAAARSAASDWVHELCRIAFQVLAGPAPLTRMTMEENLIYASRDEAVTCSCSRSPAANDFWVNVRRTEAAERCGLQGAYWLRLAGDCLQLLEPDGRGSVLHWPCRLLRRYGCDKVSTFSIEAGRRCDSGPGGFCFESRQSGHIFARVEELIREQTLSAPGPGPALQEEGEAEPPARRRLPDPPVPPSPRSADLLEQSSPYAEPADCLRSAPARHRQGNQLEPLYSGVYDPVGTDLAQRTGSLELEKGQGGGDGSPASDERAGGEGPEPVYSQVVKHALPRRTRGGVSDIIYDNLGEV
uniref:Docking protein 1 n=1 Tax=Scleropages formosus TaxID=113540 RepID=A0A8C9SYQ0_SCLFO